MSGSSEILQLDELSTALRFNLHLLSNNTADGGDAPSKKKQAQAAAPSSKDDTQEKGGSGYDRWTLQDPSLIDYGYLAKTGGAGIDQVDSSSDADDAAFYITTAINYTNGPAHMGHAYEAVTADVLARFHRLQNSGSTNNNKPTYFVTGSDEHGQKIANTAADQGRAPIDICNQYVTGFQVLNQRTLISFDDYIRTTSDRHKRTARDLWKRCHAAGDIYLDTYEGWYNIREETFVTDNDAALQDYKDPTSGAPLKKVSEESYFFKMSQYQDRLIKHIQSHPEFILPEQHRHVILQRLQQDGLRDLSISRTTFEWGVSVPAGFHENHVMYVWVDALSNYLTGVNGLGVNDDGSAKGLGKFWPADVHIIGKDILWFHTVIWPCLLFSAKLPLPKTVFAHGFVNDSAGEKMSKSLGNVVDPHDMLDQFEVDTFRWYLCKEAPYGGELSFSPDNMRDMHNADLCDTIGNLIHRTTSLCKSYCGGVVPDVKSFPYAVQLDQVIASYQAKLNQFELHGGANVAIAAFRDVNGYLQEQAPWKLKGDEHAETRQVIVRTALETIFALTHLLLPYLPVGATNIFRKLSAEPVSLEQLLQNYNNGTGNLTVGTTIQVGDVLYQKSQSEEEKRDAAAAAAKKKESHAEAQKRKKEAKLQAIAASKKGQAAASDPNQSPFTKMEIRVGKILKVWNHEKADKLFCEQIDVGPEAGGTREIASGLRDFYSLDDMTDRLVLVVCNLKAAKLFDFVSNGMVLAAKSADGTQVELVEPPANAVVGERVFIEGLTGEPASSTQVKKKKIWDAVAKELSTNDEGVATWEGKVISTTAGPCKAATLKGVAIS